MIYMKKNDILSSFFYVLKDQFQESKGYNKFLILALAANLPLPWVFIPYVTQSITAILLIFFIRKYIEVKKSSENNTRTTIVSFLWILPSIVGICAQIFWLPYITQLYSVVLIGTQYILTSKRSASTQKE